MRALEKQDKKHTSYNSSSIDFRPSSCHPPTSVVKDYVPYRDARGRFTCDSSQRKVYAEEFVLIGRKP